MTVAGCVTAKTAACEHIGLAARFPYSRKLPLLGCLPRAGAFGSSGAIAASSLASAARSGSKRGAWG
jgi:hypothetical protein